MALEQPAVNLSCKLPESQPGSPPHTAKAASPQQSNKQTSQKVLKKQEQKSQKLQTKSQQPSNQLLPQPVQTAPLKRAVEQLGQPKQEKCVQTTPTALESKKAELLSPKQPHVDRPPQQKPITPQLNFSAQPVMKQTVQAAVLSQRASESVLQPLDKLSSNFDLGKTKNKSDAKMAGKTSASPNVSKFPISKTIPEKQCSGKQITKGASMGATEREEQKKSKEIY
ncbi:unnamed protein product [Strongylus vulgaris]|uniref:Uncharacterized protein n=1 Tax=Strongylus vulgaris TaxID=40348 RepID=A0A3P7II44_STRVU|nr:unnamed protein product [Strongylus vulgaris]